LLYSARSYADLIYRNELALLDASATIDVFYTLTREWPDDWKGHRRRIDEELLREISWPPADRPLIYVCGPTAFVEQAANALVAMGHEPLRIKTERFGPTGS
jgi:ferredoxin-NADP reductase